MNLFTGESSDVFFGGDVPLTVRPLLERARNAPRADVGALLWTAQALAPKALPIYYALYKHHAGCREFEQAHEAASRGLREAAAQSGLPTDWQSVTPESLPAHIDFLRPGPARFWMFTLKALAFISLRQQQTPLAAALLQRIGELDTCGARIGDEVIVQMLGSQRQAPTAG